MFALPPLPASALEFMSWSWDQIAPYYDELAAREINASNVGAWLTDWSQLASLIDEQRWRLQIATSRDTADENAQKQYLHHLGTIAPAASTSEQTLKEILIASQLEPQGFAIPLRDMRADAELFREANVTLLAREQELAAEHNKIAGAQLVKWEGEEIPLIKLVPLLADADRAKRQRAFAVRFERVLQDRSTYDDLWQRVLQTRLEIAANAGFVRADGTPDYRAYRWRALKRFDYTPEDCKQFHTSIEQVVVPSATRLLDRGRRRLGLETLKPWDVALGTAADPPDQAPLIPFKDVPELIGKTAAIFHQMDPQWGNYFDLMRRENLLDLEPRPHKAAGGFCATLQVARRPFLFLSAVPLQVFVDVIFHESAHGFHILEMSALPYTSQRDLWHMPVEFIEVPTMTMELLAEAYLTRERGGFYSELDSVRALKHSLEERISSLCLFAVIDAFQHWIYENPREAMDPARCDDQFVALYRKFLPGEDWSGFEAELAMIWRRLPHIFQLPFYYIEYGIAMLGAFQLWAIARKNQAAVIADLRRAMALGNTATLPELYRTAGVAFAFDVETIGRAVNFVEETLEELEQRQV